MATKPLLSQIMPEGSAGQYPKVNATEDGWEYDTPAGGGGASGYAATVLLDRPRAFWRLNETSGTVAGDSENEFDGTYTGSPTLGASGATSDGDKAVQLSGTGQYVTVPHDAAFSIVNELTVECWAYLSASATGMWLVTKGGSTGSNYEWGLLASTTTVNFTVWQSAGASHAVASNTGLTIPTNTWTHFVGTYRAGAYVRAYVNGVKQAGSTSFSGTKGSGSSPLQIGRRADGAAALLNGRIDEVAVYSAELGSHRIAAHYAAR